MHTVLKELLATVTLNDATDKDTPSVKFHTKPSASQLLATVVT